MSMGSELSDTLFSPTPKLSLFSLPHHTPPPETITPPFQTPASVPFKWEEAPGKPRRSISGDVAGGEAPAKPKAARCLDLPPGKITNTPSPSSGKSTNTPSPSSILDGPGSGPNVSKTMSFSFRKFLDRKITNTPSPSSVLNGSGLGPSVSKTMSFSFRKLLKGEDKMINTPSPSSGVDGPNLGLDGSGMGLGPGPNVMQTMSFTSRSPEENLVWKLGDKEKVNFCSWRWGSERGFEEEVEGNCDISSPFGGVEENGTRLRKRSGFWANIYKNVKQAVPWKRRQDKRRKMNI